MPEITDTMFESCQKSFTNMLRVKLLVGLVWELVQPGVVIHAYKPSTPEAEGGQS
jgi:hypothetical protein